MPHLGYVFLLGFAMLAAGTLMAITFVIELHLPLVPGAMALMLLVWGSQLVSAAFAEHRRQTVPH
jgi:hypothetical protein